jgi:hypothetical protein
MRESHSMLTAAAFGRDHRGQHPARGAAWKITGKAGMAMSDAGTGNGHDGVRDAKGKVRVTVPRSDPEAQSTFEVDRTDPMMLLDLLVAIQRRHDPSIGFRYSCRVAMCNMCGVNVDGESVLACRVPLQAGRDEIRIEPLDGAPVVRDLIVETDQFVDEWAEDVSEWKQ